MSTRLCLLICFFLSRLPAWGMESTTVTDSPPLWTAVVLGVVQGITEWFPISSSGHLVLGRHLLSIEQQGLLFDLLVHLASLLVILGICRREIGKILAALCRFTGEKDKSWRGFMQDAHRRLALWVVAGSVPTAILGLGLRPWIHHAFHSITWVGFGLLWTAVLLSASHLWSTHRLARSLSDKDLAAMTLWDAFFIGVFQGIAIFPGISRSGSTIALGLICGLERSLAARFSFLLFIPAIAGASFLELPNVSWAHAQWPYLIIGMLATLVSGYLTVKLLLHLVQKNLFGYFAWYCAPLGLFCLWLGLP